MLSAEEIIKINNLTPHPEGGYYKETHRAALTIKCEDTHGGERNAYSSIYYLLDGTNFSAWHSVASDESWFFHAGCDLLLYTLDDDGLLTEHQLGLSSGKFQLTVSANTWFCAKPSDPSTYSFVSCCVGPAFDFKDFKLASKEELLVKFPEHSSMIEKFTRPNPVVSIESQRKTNLAAFYGSGGNSQNQNNGITLAAGQDS